MVKQLLIANGVVFLAQLAFIAGMLGVAHLLRAAKACTAVGAGLTVVAGRRRWGAVASGALLAAGSLLTRFGVFEAGIASTKDPKYVVVPQRERLEAGTNEHASTITR